MRNNLMQSRWLWLICLWLFAASGQPLPAQTGTGVFSPLQAAMTGRYDDAALATPQIVTDPTDPNPWVVVNQVLGAERFYSVGIYGNSAVLANVEGGLVWNQHEMLKNVKHYYTSESSQVGQYDWHATAVGGVAAGLGPPTPDGRYYYYQFGIAPGADLCSGAIATSFHTDGSFDITPQSLVKAYNHFFTATWEENYEIAPGLTLTLTRGPADVINSSWTITPDAAGATYETVAIDGLACAHPATTFVAAVGNDGPNGNSVGGPASGYNRISVGGLGDDAKPADYTSVAWFSGRGPQEYWDPVHGTVPAEVAKRAAVDIVAPAQWIVGPAYTGTTGSNTGGTDTTPGATNLYYVRLAGTSFAAPIVSGGAALLSDASRARQLPSASRDSRVIRAVLMNSADKLAGWDNGQHLENGVTVTRQSLDYAQGAGAMNLSRAYDQYLSGTTFVGGHNGVVSTVAKTGWDLGNVNYASAAAANSDYGIADALKAGQMMDVTLTWFRDRSTDIVTYDVTDDAFVNLDLEIWNAAFTTLYAASQSEYNNAEHLHYLLPEDGAYGIRVKYAGEVFDVSGTHGDVSYGLAWDVTTVPEPGTIVLLVSGLAALLLVRVRRMQGGPKR